MAFKFTSDTVEFLSEYRNGIAFDQNLTETTEKLQGNVGDLAQYKEVITVQISVNEDLFLTMTWDSVTGELFAPAIDFIQQGLFLGSTVQVIQGSNEGESTVDIMTGTDWNTIFLDVTNLSFLADGDHEDIWIRVKDAPTYVQYKYALVRNDETDTSNAIFESPLDGNPQAYSKTGIIGPSSGFDTLIRQGSFVSWDLSESVKARYNGTTGDFFHEYEVEHTFRIIPWRAGETDNFINSIPPDDLEGLFTFKYARALVLGYSSTIIGQSLQLGVEGSVGYVDESFNGNENIFEITSETITNDSETETIEATEVNTFNVIIGANGTPFSANQQVIVSIFRFTPKVEYENSTDTWSDAFIYDSLIQDAGVGAVNSTIIKALLVAQNSTSEIELDFTVEFSVAQQALIKSGDRWGMLFTVGDESLATDFENQVNLKLTKPFTKNNNVAGLITDQSLTYSDSFGSYAGPRLFSNRFLWDGDLVGCAVRFNLLQYNTGAFNKITKIESRIVLTKNQDTDPDVNPEDYKILFSKPLGFPSLELIVDDYIYQVVDTTVIDSFQLPLTEPLNQTNVQSVPTFPPAFQAFQVQTSLPRIPWRKWIANGQIPVEFFDSSEENDNLNNKTSNYADLLGWEVYHELYVEVTHQSAPVVKPGGLTGLEIPIVTPYHLRSDKFEVLDFNEDGNPTTVWTADWEAFDILDNLVTNLSTTQFRKLVGTANHNLGTLGAQDTWGEAYIIRKNSTGEPWHLHTDKNWNVEGNQLLPTDELLTGNENFLEISFDVDEVEIICQTNQLALTPGTYVLYGKIGKKS